MKTNRLDTLRNRDHLEVEYVPQAGFDITVANGNRMFLSYEAIAEMYQALKEDKSAAALPEEGAYIIKYDDADQEDEQFVGAGAREAALKRFDMISLNWNAHLYVKLKSNSRDCEVPDASFVIGVDADGWACARCGDFTDVCPKCAYELGEHTVGARHPEVIKWRNDALESAAEIAARYGMPGAVDDIRAMLTPPSNKCRACGGSGVAPKIAIAPPPPDVPCQTCQGSGRP